MLESFFWGVFGLILGSFANVLILRERSGLSMRGRSHCPRCGATLAWYELIPIVSFVIQKRRCRTCRGKISWQYPLVEMLMAALVLIVGLSPVPLIEKCLAIFISLMLASIAVYDLQTTLIPDRWVYLFGVLAFMLGALSMPTRNTHEFLWFFLSGPGVALPLVALWFFSDGRWMGLGDGKLVLGFGWLLGIFGAYVALFLAFVIGAVVSVFILLPLPYYARVFKTIRGFTQTPMLSLPLFFGIFRASAPINMNYENDVLIPSGGRKTRTALVSGFTMHSEVPFGPFLIVSLCILWLSALYDIAIPELVLRYLTLY